jgi:hypothetical protein
MAGRPECIEHAPGRKRAASHPREERSSGPALCLSEESVFNYGAAPETRPKLPVP